MQNIFRRCVILCSLLTVQPAMAGLYMYSKISYPNPDYGAISLEVNNRGQFTANVSTSSLDPYIWSAKGPEVRLQNIGNGYQSEVLGLNDYGMAVGVNTDLNSSTFASRAVIWHGAVASLLPGLGGDRREVALDINNAGAVAGYSYSSETKISHAVFWDGDGLHDLGTGNGWYATATALNNVGTIVGNTRLADGGQGTIWKDGTVTNIGTLGGPRSVLADVNDRGWAVGDSMLDASQENWHAILWDGSALRDLGTLGGQWSSANNIGEDSTVFGSSLTLSGRQHATIWRGDSAIDLHDLIVNPADLGSMTMMTAIGADAKGAIYGVLYDSKNYSQGTFVLTPVKEIEVTEPTPIFLVLSGIAYFLMRQKRSLRRL